MKLLRFKLNDKAGFRSLQPGFEQIFRTEWTKEEAGTLAPFVCAGPNGSGKSNLLEALAAIFFHLECKSLNYRPEIFEYDEENVPDGYREEVCIPDAFELEYLSSSLDGFKAKGDLQLPHVKIVKEHGQGPRFYICNRADVDPDTPLEGREIKLILPSYVIGYSSGENEILSLPFFKMRFIHFDEYMDAIRNGTQYSGTPEGRLVFLDQEFSQAILISLFLFEEENNLRPFRSELGLEGVQSFRIILRDKFFPQRKSRSSMPGKEVAFIPEDPEVHQGRQPEQPGEPITNQHTHAWSRLQNVMRASLDDTSGFNIFEKLRNCATSVFSVVEEENDLHTITTYYFDFWVDSACRKAFKSYFGSALDLFKAFQLLLTLNLYATSEDLKRDLYQSKSLYVNETIPKLPSDQRVMRFKDVVLKKAGAKDGIYSKALSDGENQFMHTLGLCTLYKGSNALFLLDEPETHFNPAWRSQFITILKNCLTGSNAREPLGVKIRHGFQATANTFVLPAAIESNSEMLITTHSPFLISDSKPDQVLIFSKDNIGVKVTKPNYNTLGASINKITIQSFDKSETIGEQGMMLIDEIHTRFLKKEDKQSLIEELDTKLGDSVEKMLLMKTILKAMENK